MTLPAGDSKGRILVWTISSAIVIALVVPGLVATWGETDGSPQNWIASASSAWQRQAQPEPPATVASLMPPNDLEPVAPPAIAEPIHSTVFEAPVDLDDGRFDCMVEPSASVSVGSAETGVLESVFFDRSDLVNEGQVVAVLESYVQSAHVEVAEAKSMMEEELRAAEVSLALGKRRQSRADELFLGKALSLDLRDEVNTQTKLAQLELEQVQKRKRVAELELHRAKSNLRQRTIRTPISGVGVERLKLPGEVVTEEAILTVARIDPLRVEVILPAPMFGKVTLGMRAEVRPELPADGVYIASVDVVDRVIDPASGTFGVRLELPNPDYTIPSGLHCRVSFLTNDTK